MSAPGLNTTRRDFLTGAGALVVGFTFLGRTGAALAAKPDGLIRVLAEGAQPSATESWLVLTEDAITVYSGKVELGTGIQTALSQVVVEELRLGVADIQYVQGDTRLSVSQGITAGSKSIQIGGVELRQAAATAYQALLERAAEYLDAPADRLVAEGGRFRVADKNLNRSVAYAELLKRGVAFVQLDPNVPLVDPDDYRVVGTSEPRVELPAKLDATFPYTGDIYLPGTLHGRVIRPPGRNARFASLDGAKVAQLAADGVTVVQRGNFVGVVAPTEWLASRAAATQGLVTWTAGAALMPQATLDAALRDPDNHYGTVTDMAVPASDPGAADAAIAAAGDAAVKRRYFTPFYMHAGVGASAAVADFRPQPDPETGIQLTLYSGTQNVTGLRDTVAVLLGIEAARVLVLYEEASGCYGHNGADDCAADAAVLSDAVRKPVRVQWRRQDEHAWEPLGAAMSHDVEGVVDASGITAWLHRIYALTANSRPTASAAGSLLAGELIGSPPAILPANVRNSSGRNAPVTYGFPRQRVEGKLVKSFDTSTGGRPASPLRHRFPRTTALRSLGGYSNSFANESFFDELAHAGTHDPLALRIASLPDPRAKAVCEALQPAWASRPGGNGRGAGVAYHQYETTEAHVATYVEVAVDAATGAVRVTRAVVAHDCGLIINPDGLRNQIEGNVIQGISRALKEEVNYTADRITTTVWESNTFNPLPQYTPIRFNEVPPIEIILIDRPREPAWGAGEPAIGTVGAAVANAVYAATGKRIRTLPITPARVLATPMT
ncbi:molybdopterin cofactor-binding domain-containing protein [Candidatus Solirubrobacter pratensis]|uniref:molybdopterin cofactor-binding domain-containing protein n=1 Tax=Candidatus Solirubrobacter pratensis TaxID=1298857 RepID=UPI000414E681|nr:molybdopterin cofactor-binding domain-containing protein [Candidatus Solirubrobacter pratensis]